MAVSLRVLEVDSKEKSRIDFLVCRVSLAIIQLGILLIARGSISQTKRVAAQHDKTIN